jgi:hypothetical protein
MLKSFVVLWVLVAMVAGAQAPAVAAPPVVTPPPMVSAPPPPPPPAPEPGAPPVGSQPGTPPPPAATPPGYVPGSYSPYGAPQQQEKPGPEVGLMVSESLFGMLTAAGITVLPYFLLFATPQLGLSSPDNPVPAIVFSLIFAAAPLAVAQTQVGLANGSRSFSSETWPAALAGLAGQAGVVGLFFAMGGLPHRPDLSAPIGQTCSVQNGETLCSGSVAFLLVGAIAVVPLIQMAVINLFKQPKYRPIATTSGPAKASPLRPRASPPSSGGRPRAPRQG